MNRQVAQILIGAAALTGAFFFGSVMQRRHGDLEKTKSSQPMLEHEDLVWSSAPQPNPNGNTGDATSKLSVAEATVGRTTPSPEAPGPTPPADLTGSFQRETTAAPGLERKVVQPDFSRWSAPEVSLDGRVQQPSPMLPLNPPPPLLSGPSEPRGELRPSTPAAGNSIDSFSPGKTAPESDPWTAPLSSVLLNRPALAPSGAQPRPSDSPQVKGGFAPPFGASEAAPRNATSELVPVNRETTRKIELDADSFRIHVTRVGDTLQSLALKYYGKPDFYLDIYLANQDQLESPVNLPAGKPLKIPEYDR